MNEDRRIVQKHLKTVMINDEDLLTLYVNSVDVRPGVDDFFLTFGTTLPLEINSDEDLENIEHVNAQPLFRCAVSRSVMKQMIDLMTSLYNSQTEQMQLLQQLQEKGTSDGNDFSTF